MQTSIASFMVLSVDAMVATILLFLEAVRRYSGEEKVDIAVRLVKRNMVRK